MQKLNRLGVRASGLALTMMMVAPHAHAATCESLATLTLLQGLGRLIRSKSDRGVLAVLDPRLTRMSYGRRFLASMPPAPVADAPKNPPNPPPPSSLKGNACIKPNEDHDDHAAA